jgi:hypothetical protein
MRIPNDVFVRPYFFCHTIGDYAEIPHDCPAMTTCPVMCVANISDCPTVCEDGLTLCANGSCDVVCDDDDELENPCSCNDLLFACPKTINYFDECMTLYQDPFYTNYTLCVETQIDSIPQFSILLLLDCYCVCASVFMVLLQSKTITSVGFNYIVFQHNISYNLERDMDTDRIQISYRGYNHLWFSTSNAIRYTIPSPYPNHHVLYATREDYSMGSSIS